MSAESRRKKNVFTTFVLHHPSSQLLLTLYSTGWIYERFPNPIWSAYNRVQLWLQHFKESQLYQYWNLSYSFMCMEWKKEVKASNQFLNELFHPEWSILSPLFQLVFDKNVVMQAPNLKAALHQNTNVILLGRN